jgi:chromosome segregation ATPase
MELFKTFEAASVPLHQEIENLKKKLDERNRICGELTRLNTLFATERDELKNKLKELTTPIPGVSDSVDLRFEAYEKEIESLKRELHQQRFNNEHNLSIDQKVADEIALLQSWVKHHQGSVEAVMSERNKLEQKLSESQAVYNSLVDGAARDNEKIRDLGYQLEQQKTMNPISVNMVATISDLSKKLVIAKIALEKYANTTGWDNAKITKDKSIGTTVASYTWAREALERIEEKK